MAPHPSWLNKVNYIIDYWQDPCNAPLVVYLELAREPAGEALLTWFSFGLDDVIRGYMRPSKALGSNRRGRRGKLLSRRQSWVGRHFETGREVFRRTPGFGEDVGGWIGKNLPGAQEIKGRSIHQLTRYLWMLDDVAQRALFALMVVDLTTDFLYEWATLLNESVYCRRQKSGSLYATGPGSSCGGLVICNNANAPNVVFQTGSVHWETTSGGCGPGGWTCVSGLKVRNVSSGPLQHYQQAFITDLYGTRTEQRATQIVPPHSDFDSLATFRINGPGQISLTHCALGGGGVDSYSQDVTIFGGP